MAYATAQYDFAGSVAVVTGDASGIGAEVARQLQASGATVVTWDLSAPDHTGAALRVDVTDRAGVERSAQRMVWTRSAAETPVLTPCAASMDWVNEVA